MHPQMFDALEPTQAQVNKLLFCKGAIQGCYDALERTLPGGPDKTYLLRKLREVGMWASLTIMKDSDGAPRVNDKPTSVEDD